MSYGSRLFLRIALYSMAAAGVGAALAMLLALESQRQSYQLATEVVQEIEPFPLGVDPKNATITEQLVVEEFYATYLASTDLQADSWWKRLTAYLQTNQTFQMLASPVSRIIVIWPGERTEEIAINVGNVLAWNQQQRDVFINYMTDNTFGFDQGTIPPGQYITHRQASPEDIMMLLERAFAENVDNRYTKEIEDVIPLQDALIIASLIEREASDFTNMREISGVIWNRLFIDMPLQLDASLQYVKASENESGNWWPAVRPADKFIESDFNTYQNVGLPPAPIANPSVEAIVAALNPIQTDCLFYFHSRSREYYCSETYDEHKSKIREVYPPASN